MLIFLSLALRCPLIRSLLIYAEVVLDPGDNVADHNL